jgi:guanine nucleotide-binding protein subunit alpha
MRSRTDDHDPLAIALSPPHDESPEAKAIRISREEEALRVSQAIDESIRIERQTNKKNKIVRILLLGQSESGARHFPLAPAIAYLTSRQVHDTAS